MCSLYVQNELLEQLVSKSFYPAASLTAQFFLSNTKKIILHNNTFFKVNVKLLFKQLMTRKVVYRIDNRTRTILLTINVYLLHLKNK